MLKNSLLCTKIMEIVHSIHLNYRNLFLIVYAGVRNVTERGFKNKALHFFNVIVKYENKKAPIYLCIFRTMKLRLGCQLENNFYHKFAAGITNIVAFY